MRAYVLHAQLTTDTGAYTIVLCSPGTDVLMLPLHHREHTSNNNSYMYQGKIGAHINMKKFILHSMVHAPMRNILLTKCETTPAYCYQGNKPGYQAKMISCQWLHGHRWPGLATRVTL